MHIQNNITPATSQNYIQGAAEKHDGFWNEII